MAPRLLIFRQNMGNGLRWTIGAAGLFCFFPTYDLLIRPGVPVLQLGMLPMWVIALGAGALGAMLVVAAILGLSRTLVFDADAAEMRELGAGAFGLRWARRHDLRDLGAPEVKREVETDGPDRYAVLISCPGRPHKLRVDSYADAASAQATADRIAALLSGAAASP